MLTLNKETLNNPFKKDSTSIIFVHTPFCGTCQIARKMLVTIEAMEGEDIFYDMNGSLFPEKLQEYQIKSVPCLLVLVNGEIREKVYAFHSVPFMYEKIKRYFT